MISAGIIAIMSIILIYFVVRGQGLQRELKLAQNSAKVKTRSLRAGQKQIAFMTLELQQIFSKRLEALSKRALISQDDYQIASFIMKHFEFIVMNCVEHGNTVEEALNRILENQSITIEQVNEFIKKLPSDVRMAWCQNTIDGFIAACRGFTSGSIKTQKTDSIENTESAVAS